MTALPEQEAQPLVSMRGVRVSFALPRTTVFARGNRRFSALDGVDLDLLPGESLGLVGESGCGKTTLGRVLVGLVEPESGEVRVDGASVGRKRTPDERRRVQMVFQDPMSSLNPQLQVGSVLAELLRAHHMVPEADIDRRSAELLAAVGLPARFRDVRPGTLSGGQRQRVGIARALALDPKVLVADEITSALDVSIQAQVLALLLDLTDQLGLTMLFISHNMAVVRQVCSRVAVMYLGRIVEIGPTEQLFADPQHPYTKLLLSSIPRLRGPMSVPDDDTTTTPRVARAHTGCRFAPRCPIAQPVCSQVDPLLHNANGDHASACHFSFGRTAVEINQEGIR